ncbi:hypothetical protein M2A_1886 [Tepidicaulis marinus]|uniref:Uncharacterized protein n=1 Tax=Tepidicaulis marinus TaxID=1333998 RepID=A0A081BBG9_9HYPH|nr:hypothetical protein M2A_1886 [Tepidicaulis marinus]
MTPVFQRLKIGAADAQAFGNLRQILAAFQPGRAQLVAHPLHRGAARLGHIVANVAKLEPAAASFLLSI